MDAAARGLGALFESVMPIRRKSSPLAHRCTVKLLCLSVLSLMLLAVPVQAQRATPDPATTPGAIDRQITQANIGSTICRQGYAKSVRPPEAYINRLKSRQLAALGLPRSELRLFEEDYLIPLELGGAPRDPRNLWLEPLTGPWSAQDKDKLENRLNRLVCTGWVTLAEAQREIAIDWVGAFIKYVWRNVE